MKRFILNQDLISQLKKGEIAIDNKAKAKHKGLLNCVLLNAFPDDFLADGTCNYYHRDNERTKLRWKSNSKIDIKSVELNSFILSEFDVKFNYELINMLAEGNLAIKNDRKDIVLLRDILTEAFPGDRGITAFKSNYYMRNPERHDRWTPADEVDVNYCNVVDFLSLGKDDKEIYFINKLKHEKEIINRNKLNDISAENYASVSKHQIKEDFIDYLIEKLTS